jgi:hypothetical protein
MAVKGFTVHSPVVCYVYGRSKYSGYFDSCLGKHKGICGPNVKIAESRFMHFNLFFNPKFCPSEIFQIKISPLLFIIFTERNFR